MAISKRYIISNGVNGHELPRAMALCGADSFALRVVTPLEAAQDALARARIAAPTLLSSFGQRALMLEAMKGVGYFDETAECSRNVCRGLDLLRGLICADSVCEERESIEQALCSDGAEGIFREKNRALYSIYSGYMTKCKQNDVTDAVTLLRLALKEGSRIDGEWLELEEFPLTPLERALAEKLSGGTLKQISVSELFAGNNEKPVECRTGALTRGYGDTNECERVLSRIAEEKLPLDSVVVAVTDPARYSQVFYDLSIQLDIPMTFGCGVPAGIAPAATLLELLREWYIRPCAATLENMINSECFDRGKLADALELPDKIHLAAVVKRAGMLRLSMDAAVNAKRITAARTADDKEPKELYDAVTKFAAELQSGWEHIIRSYSVIRTSLTRQRVIDAAARDMLCTALHELTAYESTRGCIAETVPELLRRRVAASCCAEGALHITTLDGALGSARKHLFVCGLSASAFPGKVQEDAVALDDDILRCAAMMGIDKDDITLPLSENKVKRRAARLEQLERLYSVIGDSPRYSYSGYELTEHKEENPSAALFNLWSKANEGAGYDAFTAAFEDAGFFSTGVSPLYADVRRAPAAEEEETAQPDSAEQETEPEMRIKVDLDSISLSATGYSDWYACPRRYMLKYILRLRVEEKQDEWLPANDYGTLIHTIMERMAKENIGKDDKERFMQMAEEVFDSYCAVNPPPYDAVGRKADFMATAEKAFDGDPGNEPLADLSEKRIDALHPSGVRLNGRPDRIEKAPDGHIILVDYKSGKKIKHVKDDPDSCFQALVYGYLLKTQNIAAFEAQFRYPAAKSVVSCKLDRSMEAELNSRLEAFVADVSSGVFPEGTEEHNDGYSPCTYCEYKQFGLCKRQ